MKININYEPVNETLERYGSHWFTQEQLKEIREA